MSKYQLLCSCLNCKTSTTVQSLKQHYIKCTSPSKHECLQCGASTDNEKFCCNSCKATYLNQRRPPKPRSVKPSREDLTMDLFIEGKISERATLRKYLAKIRGYRCETCGIAEWNDQPITLIVDHQDGNAGNNHPTNLRLLCPNCNSQTPTFGGRNKGSGRKARGLPLN